MKEEQVLGISEKCVNCHQREYALWSSGAHATTYADIFLDGKKIGEQKSSMAVMGLDPRNSTRVW